jgi:hypothetical protein
MLLELVLKYRKRIATAGLLALLMVVVFVGRGGAGQESPETYDIQSYQEKPDPRLPESAGNYALSNPGIFKGVTFWFSVEGYDGVTCLFTSDGTKWYRKNESDLCSKWVGVKQYDYYFGLPPKFLSISVLSKIKPAYYEDYRDPNYTIRYSYTTGIKTRYSLINNMTLTFYDLNGKWVLETEYNSYMATRQAFSATLMASMAKMRKTPTATQAPMYNSAPITNTPNATATKMMADYLKSQAEQQAYKNYLKQDERIGEQRWETYMGPDCDFYPYSPGCY